MIMQVDSEAIENTVDTIEGTIALLNELIRLSIPSQRPPEYSLTLDELVLRVHDLTGEPLAAGALRRKLVSQFGYDHGDRMFHWGVSPFVEWLLVPQEYAAIQPELIACIEQGLVLTVDATACEELMLNGLPYIRVKIKLPTPDA